MKVLIPIAKSNQTGETVFIEEVSSGLGCDCRCLGCDVPLVAKKGDLKIHHFSHAPGEINKDHSCPFSFERSVFLMIRLLLAKASSIALPAYSISLSERLFSAPTHCQVTHKSELIIDRVEFPKKIDKFRQTDSAIIFRSGYPLALSFYLKKANFNLANYQNNSPYPYRHNGNDIAHLAIDLSELQKLFRNKKCDYRLLLKKFLFESRLNKKWLYHPNEMPYRNSFKHQVETLRTENDRLEQLERQRIQQKTPVHNEPEQAAPVEIISHVAIAKSIDEMKHSSQLRLAQLLQQVFEFKLQGNTQGYRCCECYFMNSEEAECQFCRSTHLEHEILNDDYFDNIDHKYDCACFPIKSLKKLPGVKIQISDELTNSVLSKAMNT